MGKMIVEVMEFRGDDEFSRTSDVIEPIVYADGTVELQIDLVGKRMVYITLSIAALVSIAMTQERTER